jgi:hypothetical protein
VSRCSLTPPNPPNPPPPNGGIKAPFPQGNDLLAAWAAGPDDLYVGGHGGVILHWDGSDWTPMETGTQKTIFAMHGTSATDIWAVGGQPYTFDSSDMSLILHYDGNTWSEMTPPDFFGQTYVFNSVHAVSENEVYCAIGISPTLAHYNGTVWELFNPPLAVEGSFKGIASVGTDHLFVYGTHGQILHRDMGEWKLEQKIETSTIITYNILTSMWAHDLDTVYCGGNWGQVYRRNNDGSWTDLMFPTELGSDNSVNLITGMSPTEVYILGGNSVRRYTGSGDPVRFEYSQVIRRQWFDGANAGDRLYGVGPAGVVHEILLPFGGDPILSPLSAGKYSLNQVRQLRATGCGEGFLVHGNSEGSGNAPLQYFDGTEIAEFPTLPTALQTDGFVRAAIAGGFDDIVINWYGLNLAERGVAHWNGSSWQDLGSGNFASTPSNVLDFWRSPGGTLYACAVLQVHRYDGPEWTVVLPFDQLPEQTALTTIWGRSDSDIFVGSATGKIWHYNGSSWTEETTPGTTSVPGLVRLRGTATEVYAVGSDGLAWRRNGTTWEQLSGVAANTGEDFGDLISDGDKVVACQKTPSMYTGGGLGRLWEFSGSTATLVKEGISEPLIALARTTSGNLYGIGSLNGNTVVMTTAPALEDFDLRRADLSSGQFQPLGDTGISLQPGSVSQSKPVVASWRIDRAPALFDQTAQKTLPSLGQQWMLLSDETYWGPAVGPSLLRFDFNPALLPAEFMNEAATLFGYTDSAWTSRGTAFDSVSHTAELLAPASLGPWTLGQTDATPTPPPTGTVTPTSTPMATFTPTATNTPEATFTPVATFTPIPTVTSTSPPLPDLFLEPSAGIGTDPMNAPLHQPFHFSVKVTYRGEPMALQVPVDIQMLGIEGAVGLGGGYRTFADLSTGSFSAWIPYVSEIDPSERQGTFSLVATADPGNLIQEADEGNNKSWSSIDFSIATGSGGGGGGGTSDTQPPSGTMSINSGGQVVSDTSIDLNFSASDNSGTVTEMFIREWWLSDTGDWVVNWETGWMPYSTSYPDYFILWSGFYCFETFFADAAGNVSAPASKCVNVAMPTDSLGAGQLCWFVVQSHAGQFISVTVDSLLGDCDIGVWNPRNNSPEPDYFSGNLGEVQDQVSFNAPMTGKYWVGVYAYYDTVFGLSLVAPGKSSDIDPEFIKETRPAGFAGIIVPATSAAPVSRLFTAYEEENNDVLLWLARLARTWSLNMEDEGYDGRCDFWPGDHRIDGRDLLRILDPRVPPMKPEAERP